MSLESGPRCWERLCFCVAEMNLAHIQSRGLGVSLRERRVPGRHSTSLHTDVSPLASPAKTAPAHGSHYKAPFTQAKKRAYLTVSP